MLPNADDVQIDDRTDVMKALFGRGLGASNIWYGHAHALTFVQPELPDDFEALCEAEGRLCTTYENSGWCYVEASLSSLIKGGTRRIDIAKFTNDGMLPARHLSIAMDGCANDSRPPPMLPSQVASDLEHKSFFSRADVPTVAQLYETFFDAVAPHQTQLMLNGLSWGPEEVAKLAAALPRFERLVELDVSFNEVGPGGGKALAAALRVNTSLTELHLSTCSIKDEGAVAIATALMENELNKIAKLNLHGCSISDVSVKPLAALCAASRSLEELQVTGNRKLGNAGKAALKEAELSRPGLKLIV